MKIADKIIGKIIKSDKRSRNVQQNYIAKKVGNKYMLFDTNTDEFLIGYSFNKSEDAQSFASKLK